ncbi:hypothetical protein [Inquilinus sp.]|jgi:predicted transcriptional regulator|uniref:hypothetical protein n=1 Tax=Inquilinus sp. TaxID=1932117 RepID=UPI003784A105
MAKEMLLTVRMDAELHKAFMDAAQALDRPASQVARELVRSFVQRQSRNAEFEEAVRRHEARLAQDMPHGTEEEYQAFLAEKVRLGREDIAAGRTVSHEQVVAEGEARRAALLKRLGRR